MTNIYSPFMPLKRPLMDQFIKHALDAYPLKCVGYFRSPFQFFHFIAVFGLISK